MESPFKKTTEVSDQDDKRKKTLEEIRELLSRIDRDEERDSAALNERQDLALAKLRALDLTDEELAEELPQVLPGYFPGLLRSIESKVYDVFGHRPLIV